MLAKVKMLVEEIMHIRCRLQRRKLKGMWIIINNYYKQWNMWR